MLTELDRKQIEASGRHPDEVERALAELARPTRFVEVLRPATLSDGIAPLDDRLMPLWAAAARAGRISHLIPASGAATRLAASLDADALRMYPHIAEALGELDPSRLPKALVPVHAYAEGARTPLEEHIREGLAMSEGAPGPVSLHFTVGEADLPRFLAHAAEIQDRLGVDLELGFSTQDPSTDVPWLGSDGGPARDRSGQLRFRPGGHGALFGNLSGLDADLVLVKNIDNVVVDRERDAVLRARRLLVGATVAARQALRDARAAGPEAVRAWFRTHCHEEIDDVDEALGRPLRVCGMVRNTGAPGGGPFWTEQGLQIVEGVEIDRADPQQQALLDASTHFNPVELVLSLRDLDGRAIELERYRDGERVLRASKTIEGASCRVLEHPGLWNGCMARWISLFVEVPLLVFAPIKTSADLAHPAHRAD